MFLLVVALELLGLVVAARRALPGAVVESILEGGGLLVKVMVPCGLTFRALSAGSSEGRGESHGILQLGNGAEVEIIGDDGDFAVLAEQIELVRNRLRIFRAIGQYIPR